MKLSLKRLLWILLALFLAIGLFVGIAYLLDRNKRIAALQAGGTQIQTDAGLIEYELVGEAGGDVLLFFHGTPGGYDQGIGAVDGSRVLTLSRPGYLGTPLATGATPLAQAQAAAALLDALEIKQVAVMGASGGGPAAYSFAAVYPERTVGLVAMEAVSQAIPLDGGGLPDSDFLFWLMIQSLVLSQDDAGVVAQIAQNESDRARLAEQPDRQSQVAGMIWSTWPPSMRSAGLENDSAQFARLDLPLESIRVPTLIVHGTLDQAVPFEHAQSALARIPGAKLHPLDGAGHMMPFAHEVEVNAVVTEFLSQLAD